jgi:hypothetical protein
MSRLPVVADRFYPGKKSLLKQTVTELLQKYSPPEREHGSEPGRVHAFGVISPHAGYIYSGGVCAETLKSVTIPETVVILGPNHHGRGPAISLSRQDWETPLGTVPVNSDFSERLLEFNTEILTDEVAHQYEHSLEVQLPFLQVLQERLSIVPLTLSRLSYSTCEKLADSLARTISHYGNPVLMLASSDMTHYESRKSAKKKDALVLDQLTALNPRGLYQTVEDSRISMCGVIPVTVVLLASLQLGANRAEIVRYTDSGEVSKDLDQVVGYAGAVIYKD